jgi:hypothetical protein
MRSHEGLLDRATERRMMATPQAFRPGRPAALTRAKTSSSHPQQCVHPSGLHRRRVPRIQPEGVRMMIGNCIQRVATTTAAFAVGLAAAFVAPAAVAAPVVLKLQATGTTVPLAGPVGGAAVAAFEIDEAVVSGDADSGDGEDDFGDDTRVNRSIVHGRKGVSSGGHGGKAKSNPELIQSFDGLDFFNQRFANNGNQFSVEPPDQGLCAGNGFVLESVNDVLSIHDTSGNLLRGPVDLNTFYGYIAAINRTTNARGPSLTDPSCYYDADTQRWFQVVLTLDHVGTTPSLNGNNHIDIAVSRTADPTGAWTLYRLPVQNNGTQGTPNHHCGSGFCLGDYPHIGADANVIMITTNEFAFAGPGFYGSQIYAISKRALAANASTANVVMWNGGDPSIPAPAFTVWPATSPGAQYATDNGGTEYLLSSDAVFFDDGVSSEIWVWAITNTSAIDANPAALALAVKPVGVQQYGVPLADIVQKPGNTPLVDCVADPTCAPLVGFPVAILSKPRRMATNDSRMQQVTYANGKLWGALDTDVLQGTTHASGVAYFVLNPNSGKMFANATLALPDASLSYPAVGVTKSGRGVIAFTVAGPNNYPSAGYASLDAKIGAGDVHIIAAGAGPWDGFTGIPASGSGPRWGDYGATAVDGDTIWVASEYIAQTCTYAQYRAAPFGTCGGTRGSLGNWATRISELIP